MHVININLFFVLCFILCEQIAAQAKILEKDKHEDSIHHVNIENNENALMKTQEIVKSEKSKFEIPPLKYTKNEYEYKPVDKQNPSNATNRNGMAENVSKIMLITKTPQETLKNVKKKDIEQAPTETVKPRMVNSKTVESSEMKRTHQLETSVNNPHNRKNKATDHVDHNCSFDSNINSGNSRKHIKENLKKVCPESESSHNLKSVPEEKVPQNMKVESKTNSLIGRANDKEGKVLYFEEIDTDEDHSETSSDSVKSKSVLKVQKAESDNIPTSPDSEVPEKAIVLPKINTTIVESIEKGKISNNFASINSKNILPEVSTDQHLKSVTAGSNNNNCDRKADPELLTTSEKPDFYEESNLHRRLDDSSDQDEQEKSNLLNLVKSILDETIGPTADIVVKTYNVNELIETHKNLDERNDKKCTCDNNNDRTNELYTILHYVLEPKTALDTQYRYVETAQYVPPYSNNYYRNRHDQNSIPQQNYFYSNLAQQYNPYKMYSQEYRGQSYYPKATGAYYPPPSENPKATGAYYPPPSKYPKATGAYYPPPSEYPKATGAYYPPPSENPKATGAYYPPPSENPKATGAYYPPPSENPKATGAYYVYPSPSEYNNKFKPDYTYAAPSYKYPFEDQLQDKVEPTNNNYITDWNTRNYQRQPGMYSTYYQPLVYDFSKFEYPKDYFDRIWRRWQDTEIQIKRPKTKADMPCKKCGSNRRKLNNRPLINLNNQRKNVIGGNGYY